MFTFFSIIIGIIFCNVSIVYATSWIKLSPAEVDKRAEVVVYGRYDFDTSFRKSRNATGIFSKFRFKVNKYYRGNGPEEITAGIDMYDVGWAKQFQEEGGCFLLFLEKDTKDKDFLIPIAGPNGMVQFINEKVRAVNIEEENYYNNFLQNQDAITPQHEETHKISIAYIIFIIITIVCIIIALKIVRKKNRKY